MPHKHAPHHGVPDHEPGTSTEDHRHELTPRLAQLAAILGWGPRRFTDDQWQALQQIAGWETTTNVACTASQSPVDGLAARNGHPYTPEQIPDRGEAYSG